VITLLITAIVLFVHAVTRRTARRAPAGTSSAATAELLLDERFARGEIDAEEYRNRRRVLQSGPHW
jgi:putative membrane protein